MKPATFLKSTLILTIATLLSKLLGSLFRVPLQNIAGDEVLGIFSLVYPVYMVALILSVAGIPIAISKLIAEARSTGTEADIFHIRKTARILALLLGISGTGLLLVFSEPLSQMIGGSSTRPSLIIISFTLMIAPYMAVDRGYFQGFEDMRPTAISQVLEQFVRVIFLLFIAYTLANSAFSNSIVAGGVMVGSTLGVLASLVYLKFHLSRSDFEIKNGYPYHWPQFKYWGKKILSVSIPIAIGTLTMALFNVVDSLTVPGNLQGLHEEKDITFLYGIYGRGLALVQIATVFATSVILPLIPSLTKSMKDGKLNETRNLIEGTRWLTHTLAWPLAVLLLVLTIPINMTLFTDTQGSLTIGIMNISTIFISLTLVGTAVLQGLNISRTAAFIIVAGALMKGVFNFLLVPAYGIEGAAIGTLLTYIAIVAINTYMIHKTIRIPWIPPHFFKVVTLSLFLGGLTSSFYLFTQPLEWERLVSLCVVLFTSLFYMILFIVCLFKWKAIDQRMVDQIPFLSKFTR
ncbi:Membrane protein involved in the export of O-antigen and teichoic acid [Halobacillus dabanensis]|uniref:Membrane protein involved in the export of O-antigen and teichoic acid n=1 Tax=Halobacillus dabanensis TaxID=240302 RepID=A0A1I3XE61_HALDA|nr:polysaccharide biosynthesis protein [Halobacillus dabanensis]SFK17823.1 Membrane protein involved in the export of O-antigen and teichoic acid [Halobacillus dabanensis]